MFWISTALLTTEFSGSSTSKEGKMKTFSGMKAKENFYEKRKMLKQQKKFGLSTKKTTLSKAKRKNNNRTSFKQRKKEK